jgi:hypothetical protein
VSPGGISATLNAGFDIDGGIHIAIVFRATVQTRPGTNI